MTTVSKPNRNPASADVMAQKTIRRFKAWDLREVSVDEAVEVLISNAPTRVTRRDRSRSATTGNARWPRQPAGPGGQVPLSPLPRRLWCWPTDCQTGRNADGGDRPRTHASFPGRSCGASHSSQPLELPHPRHDAVPTGAGQVHKPSLAFGELRLGKPSEFVTGE